MRDSTVREPSLLVRDTQKLPSLAIVAGTRETRVVVVVVGG
jgi:hypothetical protein